MIKSINTVDKYVLGCTVISFFAVFLIKVSYWSTTLTKILSLILIVAACCRIYQIITYFLVNFIFNFIEEEDKNSKRLIILACLNYLEVLFWFAALYRNFSAHFHNGALCVSNVGGALYYSVVTISTVGYGDISPIDNLGAFLCSAQILIGIFLIVIFFARFVSFLPSPKVKQENGNIPKSNDTSKE